MTLESILIGLVYLLNIVLAAVVIFKERKDVGSTWAWLLVLFFIPVLGFIMYLLTAQNFRRKHLFYWEDWGKVGVEQLLAEQLTRIESGRFHYGNETSRANKDLIYMQLCNNNAFYTEDNELDIFTDGEAKFSRLFQDIEAARDYIHVQYYIIQNDKLGRRLIDALTEKAKQGVKVRVLYDELGSRGLKRGFFRKYREAGGLAEAFFPSKLRLLNFRINFRNHRKLVIIDGKIGYVGGFNVGDEYLGLNERFGYWRDTHLRIQGTAVYALHMRFILDWNQASSRNVIHYAPSLFPPMESKGDVGLQIVTSGPDSDFEHIKNGYMKMIASAKESIYIQTPYFIPDSSLMDAIRIAALSGVAVHLMIPDKPDHIFVYWATLSYVGELLKAGVKVYQYNNGFIHAKTIVVDERLASVGTANIDNRSLKLNFEVNAFIYDESVSKRLADIFAQDLAVSRPLYLEQYERRPGWVRFKESISRLLSPIL
ncbi:cardiolipin synthase [Paenibacillus thermotolerans]|uniref:cardiolipin synthase n=1 Tax=Paenibacillus thermotolerans TaxID=3027807 RepID=UPI002368B374|nr:MULTISPECIES: cardiolipin synthase [unclassified Paenibacillus]